MRTSYVFVLGFVVTNLSACNEQTSAPAAQSSAAPTAQAAAPTATAEATPPPDDLDVKALQKQLVCPADPKGGPCAILAAIASCKAWSGSTPSGDGRWIGRGHRVEDGKTTEEFTILRARRVPSNDVGPGQLPVKIGVADIAKAEGAAYEQADRAIKAFSKHDIPSRGNAAVGFLERKDQWPEGFAMRTVGGQVYAQLEGGVFVCEGPKQQLIVVQRASTRGGKADGVYAEVWPTTW